MPFGNEYKADAGGCSTESPGISRPDGTLHLARDDFQLLGSNFTMKPRLSASVEARIQNLNFDFFLGRQCQYAGEEIQPQLLVSQSRKCEGKQPVLVVCALISCNVLWALGISCIFHIGYFYLKMSLRSYSHAHIISLGTKSKLVHFFLPHLIHLAHKIVEL